MFIYSLKQRSCLLSTQTCIIYMQLKSLLMSIWKVEVLLVYSTASEISKYPIILHILDNQCSRILQYSYQQAFCLFWDDTPV